MGPGRVNLRSWGAGWGDQAGDGARTWDGDNTSRGHLDGGTGEAQGGESWAESRGLVDDLGSVCNITGSGNN